MYYYAGARGGVAFKIQTVWRVSWHSFRDAGSEDRETLSRLLQAPGCGGRHFAIPAAPVYRVVVVGVAAHTLKMTTVLRSGLRAFRSSSSS